ncbi:MAG: S-layer homology domain-containing protein [Oscillospiraceae bacterium]|nr:S-layer homology domain-containing protein [Oscillospiraceae bacterium]
MNQKVSPRRRALSLLLALSLILGLLPASALAAEEAGAPDAAPAGHWAAGYLNQLVEWGFIRADQAQEPDRPLTRADFMSIVNRAYGYHEVGPTPFEDVNEYDWFYDDVGIAYTARYINGTSPVTASPNDPLNRETAATILGRNMMLQESPGEILDFSDARDISNWARGTIKSSMEHYLVNGYGDGTFRPQQTMSWGEIAAMLTRTVGTPLQDEGEYSLGGVFGNVTVTSPGVTLRDTVISGDLYITGGVGLGGIKLENVTVLGRIIASGTGSSEGGASILLRNVTADELLLDNLQDKEVSIQADGITEIGRTTVRSSAYIEDNTPDGLGLHMISFEGDSYGEDDEVPEGWEPPRLTLAGRVEEVVNRTPDSTVHVAKGTVAKLTVDEEAAGSQVVIDRGAVVKDLVLDTGVDVTGEGDITKLEVNAAGSNVAMLPDEIEIRPGVTAVIAGEVMDAMSAEEASLEPLILSGYPKASDVAPTSLDVVFATNKKGRIYWAVSTITDGSVGVDALLKPPSYGNIAVKWGTTDSLKGNEEKTAHITGLLPDGSYYLSAVLEDARGQLSPVKVISFTTPDNTVPAFAQGYPHMSKTSRRESVAVVMPTKDCKLYYALLPQAAQAPTVNELKAGAVSGALGYGVQDVYKNVESTFRINDRVLEEQTTYVVYFWLTDANGANSSAVVPLTFTTADETPPTFVMGPLAGKPQERSVPINFRLSEDGTVFWAVVLEGDPYPQPETGQSGTAPLDSMTAKLQVASGQGALLSGQVSASAARDGTFTVSGLEPEKSYDLYYVAQDKAGNYSLTVGKMTINTADSTGPIVKLLSAKDFRVSSSIVFEFSENVKPDANGPITQDLLALYKATLTAADKEQAKKNLRDALTYCIDLYQRTQGMGTGDVLLKSRPYPYDASADWGIDFSQAVVTSAKDGSGKIEVTIPSTGHQLQSAGTYYFKIHNLTDNAGNRLRGNLAEVDYSTDPQWEHSMPIFTVVFAEIYLAQTPEPDADELPKKDGATIRPDAFFRMIPQTTSSVVEGRTYDLLMFTNKTMRFELYYRVVDTTKPATVNGQPNPDRYPTTTDKYVANMPGASGQEHLGDYGWIKLGDDSALITNGNENGEPKVGVSLQAQFNNRSIPELKDLDDSKKVYYEFAIRVLQINEDGIDKKDTWGDDLQMEVYAAAATPTSMRNLTISNNAITEKLWAEYQTRGLAANNGAVDVGTTDTADKFLTMDIPFPSTGNPKFDADTPKLTPGDTYVRMELAPDIACRIYYVIAPVGSITTTVSTGNAGGFSNGQLLAETNFTPNDPDDPSAGGTYAPYEGPFVPKSSAAGDPNEEYANATANGWVTNPSNLSIWNPKYTDRRIKISSAPDPDDPRKTVRYLPYPGGGYTWPETVTDLEPETDYYAYFVLESLTTGRPSRVYLYTFRTGEISNPKLSLGRAGDGRVNAKTDTNSYVDWIMFTMQELAHVELRGKRIGSISFSECMDEKTKTELEAAGSPYVATSYTILDALMDPEQLEYSVFDRYADTREGSIRGDLTALIRGGTSGAGVGGTDQGRAHTTKKSGLNEATDIINATKNMQKRDRHVVLALAYHENANENLISGFSFKALQNVFVPDTDPPKVTSVTTSIRQKTVNGYTGTVTINFDRDVYFSPDGGEAWNILVTTPQAAGGSVNPDGDGYIELFNHMSGMAARRLYIQSSITTPRSSFTFDFSNVQAGWDLFMLTSGFFCNSEGYSTKDTLQLTFVEQGDRAGFSGKWGNSTPQINLGQVAAGSGDIEIRFTGNKVSGGPGSFKLNLDETTRESDVTAVLFTDPGAENCLRSWELSEEDKAIITVTKEFDTTGNYVAKIKAEGIGTAHVTFRVTTLDGNSTFEVLEVNVKDNNITTVGLVPVDDSTSETAGSGETYTWKRTNSAAQPNPSATLTFSTSLKNTKVTVSPESKSPNVVSVSGWTKPTDNTIAVSLRYAGRPGDTTDIVVTIGEGAGAVRKTVTITLDGENESGLTIAAKTNPFAS